MQGRLIDGRCYFGCDTANCGAQFHSRFQVFTPAVKEARDFGWHTETVGPGRYAHRCPCCAKSAT